MRRSFRVYVEIELDFEKFWISSRIKGPEVEKNLLEAKTSEEAGQQF